MAAVSPAGPDPMMMTWRDSVTVALGGGRGAVRCDQATKPADDEQGPDHQVGHPDPTRV